MNDITKKIKQIITERKIGKDTFVIFILLGVLLFIIALPVKKDTDQKNTNSADVSSSKENSSILAKKEEEPASRQQQSEENTETMEYIDTLEHKLDTILSYMEGAGRVKTMITLHSSKEEVVEKDTPNTRSSTSEADAEGGNRNVDDMSNEEITVYSKDKDGNQIPYVIKSIEPDIEGVLVLAQGGDSAYVKKNITEIIQALFGIEAHKIKVVKMKIK